MRRGARAAACLAVIPAVGVSFGLAGAAQSESKTIHDGVFTSEQVESGAEVYDKICLECHPRDYFGPAYMTGWEGATVAELFGMVESTMPYENPGTLERREVMEVLVYIFSLNGVPSGDSEMGDSSEALKGIVIDGPFVWKGDRR